MSQPISSGTISITNRDIRNDSPSGGPNYAYWSSGVTYYDYDDGYLPTGPYTAAGAISVTNAIRGILYLGYRNIVQTWNSSYNTWQYEYKVTQLALWRQLGLRSSNSGYGSTVWDRATTLINQGKALSNSYPVNNFSVFKFTRSGALTLIGVSNVVKLSLNANGGNAASYAGLSYIWMPQSVASALPPAITRNNSGDVNSFTISFNANGGTSTPSAITNKKYYSYSFYRWAINSSTMYAASSNYTPSAATSMYASWSETAHQRAITLPAAISHNNGQASRTVTFNANGGSVSPTTKTSTATVTYSFNGWHWGSASGTTYAAKASYTPSATGTMYAGWNSSTGSFGSISTPTPSRTGYTFAGWWTAKSGGTKRASSYVPSGNETVYAHWTANTYTITLNKNGGTGGTNSVSIAYNTAKGSYPSITKPTRTGYTFNGYWDTSAASGGTEWYDANGNSLRTFNLTANTTWYARWTANTYTVAYALNGGTQAHTNGQRVASGNFTFVYNPTTVAYNMSNFAALDSSHPVNGYLQVDRPTRTGYTFSHWVISGMDSTTHLYWGTNGATSFTSTSLDTRNTTPPSPGAWAQLRATAGTVTFTANWTEITATLSFNMLGGSGGPSAITMKYTTATTIPAASTWPTSTGYACIGWATSEARAKNGNVDYTAGATYKAANVVPTAATLYAVWRSTVSYNANNGTGAPATGYMYYTPAFTVSTTQPTCTGYTFDHWNTAADNSGTSFSSGAQLKAANAWKANTTLYAQWNRNLFNVTINLDGGTQPNGRDVLTQNGEQTIVHNPTVASYDMKNFTPMSGTSYVNEFMCIDRPTKTGYAFNHWVITGMDNITHNVWLGSGAVAFMGTTYDTSAFSDPTAGNYQYLRATAGTVVFTAHYTANTYTLYVYPNGGVFHNSTGTAFPNGLIYDSTNNNVLDIPTRTGYSFDGWWTDPVNGELVYDAIAGEAVQGTYWSATGSSAVYKHTGDLTVYAHWKPSGVVRWQYKLVDDHGNEIVDDNGNNIVSVQKYAVFRWNGTEWERCSPYGYHNNEWKIGE